VAAALEQRAVELAVGIQVPAIVVIIVTLPVATLARRHRIRFASVPGRTCRQRCTHTGDRE
jgi:hypothetical protein